MVIKKPYAFLIKHFRLIHGILFGLLLIIGINYINIYSFFSEYAKAGYFTDLNNLAGHYVPIYLFLLALFAVLVSFVIYYILSIKQRENKIYLWSFLFYIILFVFFIYARNIFGDLGTKYLKVESVRVIRDICFILLVPQILFCFIVLSRTLGFNLKQFEFKKDLEELEIESTDAEEVELSFKGESYKLMRSLRKFLRLAKYFVIENKMFVIGTVSVLLFSISVSLYTKLDIYSVSYDESQDIIANGLSYVVNDSYISNSDMNNVVISKGKSYILVDITIKNNMSYNIEMDRNSFKLLVNGNLITPAFNVNSKFRDIKETFTEGEIASGDKKNYIIVYEINDEDIAVEYLFKIKSGTEYKDVLVKPTDLNKNSDEGNYKLPASIDFKNSMLNESKIVISSYEIADKFKEKSTIEIDGKKQEIIYSILPENQKGKVSIIKIKGSINMDQNVYISKYISCPADLLEYYGIIKYRYMGNYKEIKLKKINVKYEIDDYSYLEIPSEVEKANKIDLIILIRGVKYTINLK